MNAACGSANREPYSAYTFWAADVAGAFGARLGVRPAMLVMGGIHLAATLSYCVTRIGRSRVLPARVSAAGLQ